MSVRVEVRPRVLERARSRSGIADEIWEHRLCRYEVGLARQAAPTLKQLENFARKTHTPVGFLFLDEPSVESVPIPELRTNGDRPIAAAGAVIAADLTDVIDACQARPESYRGHQLLNGEAPLLEVGA